MAHGQNRDRDLNRGRRTFLRSSAALAVGALPGARQILASHFGNPPSLGSSSTISEHLVVFHGPIHVGIVRDGDRAVLIDCGDGRVQSALDQFGITNVERLLFTHYHRDQVCGSSLFPESARRGVPEKEREYFAAPTDYWQDDRQLYRVYRSFRPDHLMPVAPVRADDLYRGGHQIPFGPAVIRVIDTPGHTEGSVSYLVEVDGKRVLFSGDLIAGDGQIWDVYSLQKGFSRGDQSVGGYHGFMGDRWQLSDSLQTAKECEPDLIVPSHGTLISNPTEAIDKLTERLEECYENYVSISALRHYFPRLFEDYAGRPGQMPIRDGKEPPACLRHFGTTWMVVSESGAAFVMDAGSKATVDRLKKMVSDEEIKTIDALWVTHYHYDHTDGIPEFQRSFDCPCITDKRLADVLVRPAAWRLPCLAPDPIVVHRPMQDGQSWDWHEFKLTSYYFPGQTLYHAALLVEKDGMRMLFVGDSHTPAGLDDYCAHNRNWLGRKVGFQYCITLIEKLQPTHIFNCHVDVAFSFTSDEIAFMRRQLDRREQLLGQLSPWPHANFATDPSWVRADPYRLLCRPGQDVTLKVVLTNHATRRADCKVRACLPQAWGGGKTQWTARPVSGKTERELALKFAVPQDAVPQRTIVPIDVQMDDFDLPNFSECVVDVSR